LRLIRSEMNKIPFSIPKKLRRSRVRRLREQIMFNTKELNGKEDWFTRTVLPHLRQGHPVTCIAALLDVRPSILLEVLQRNEIQDLVDEALTEGREAQRERDRAWFVMAKRLELDQLKSRSGDTTKTDGSRTRDLFTGSTDE